MKLICIVEIADRFFSRQKASIKN